LRASRFFHHLVGSGLVEDLVQAQRPAGTAPWVFFMPDFSALARRRSMASTPRRPAISSTIISVAAMLCRVP
jgi:hypothetical protein